jgi:hypothetical protein
MANWMRLAAALAATAASGAAGMGCSSNTPPPPRAYVSSILTIGPSPNSATSCPLGSGPWLAIGLENGSVNDGDTQSGGGVSVQCKVASAGDNFNVFVFTELNGLNGGAFTLGTSSDSPATFAPPAGPPGTTVTSLPVSTTSNSKDPQHTLKEADCTFTYFDPQQSNGPGIAAGRVWGTVTCPHATDTSKSPNDVCQIATTFRVENCSQ